MKFNQNIYTVFLAAGLLILNQSCADQKRAVENRADRMNEDTEQAQENPENEPNYPEDLPQTTGELPATENDRLNNEGKSEMDEVIKKAPMGTKKMLGGAMIDPNSTIINNVAKAKNLSLLLSAIEKANLVNTLKGEGPFTIFAPTDSAFKSLTAAAGNKLKNSTTQALQQLLKNHIIAGNKGANDLIAAIKEGNGEASLKTLSGKTLHAKLDGEDLIIENEAGATARVEIADVKQSNGVIHVIDEVLMTEE